MRAVRVPHGLFDCFLCGKQIHYRVLAGNALTIEGVYGFLKVGEWVLINGEENTAGICCLPRSYKIDWGYVGANGNGAPIGGIA